MIKYSEVKKMVKVLRFYGWEKIKGLGFYRKTWYVDNKRLGHTLPTSGLLAAPLQYVIDMLEDIDEQASKKLYS